MSVILVLYCLFSWCHSSCVIFLNWKRSVQVFLDCLCISAYSLEILISMTGGYIARFLTQPHFCICTKPEPGCKTPHVMVSLCYMFRWQVWSFCWYWWSYWPLMFKRFVFMKCKHITIEGNLLLWTQIVRKLKLLILWRLIDDKNVWTYEDEIMGQVHRMWRE